MDMLRDRSCKYVCLSVTMYLWQCVCVIYFLSLYLFHFPGWQNLESDTQGEAHLPVFCNNDKEGRCEVVCFWWWCWLFPCMWEDFGERFSESFHVCVFFVCFLLVEYILHVHQFHSLGQGFTPSHPHSLLYFRKYACWEARISLFSVRADVSACSITKAGYETGPNGCIATTLE